MKNFKKNSIVLLTITLLVLVFVLKDDFSAIMESLKNANLIKEKVQGRNRPNKIYVGKTIAEISGEFIKATSENQSSGDSNFGTPDVRKSDANKNNILNYENKKKSSANFEQRDWSGYDWDSLYTNKD